MAHLLRGQDKYASSLPKSSRRKYGRSAGGNCVTSNKLRRLQRCIEETSAERRSTRFGTDMGPDRLGPDRLDRTGLGYKCSGLRISPELRIRPGCDEVTRGARGLTIWGTKIVLFRH